MDFVNEKGRRHMKAIMSATHRVGASKNSIDTLTGLHRSLILAIQELEECKSVVGFRLNRQKNSLSYKQSIPPYQPGENKKLSVAGTDKRQDVKE